MWKLPFVSRERYEEVKAERDKYLKRLIEAPRDPLAALAEALPDPNDPDVDKYLGMRGELTPAGLRKMAQDDAFRKAGRQAP